MTAPALNGSNVWPRPCAVGSHQFHMEGQCWALEKGVALVEGKNGVVSKYDLYGVYSLTFTDRK